jgi:undecaprenyl-diphosphatase
MDIFLRTIIKFLDFRRFKEPLILLILAALAGGVWLFMELAEGVRENHTHTIDRMILLSMRTAGDPGNPIGPYWFEESVRDVTALGGVVVLSLITVAVVCYLCLQRKAKMAMVVAVAVAGGIIFSMVLKELFNRPRPDVVPHLYQAFHSSFPSGHSMMAAVTYLTLGALMAKSQSSRLLKIYFISVAATLTGIVGLSRIYIGVHWPTDVLGGWAAGAVWALLWWLLAHWLQLLGKIEKTKKET